MCSSGLEALMPEERMLLTRRYNKNFIELQVKTSFWTIWSPEALELPGIRVRNSDYVLKITYFPSGKSFHKLRD